MGVFLYPFSGGRSSSTVEQSREGSVFLFQHACAPVNKASSIKKRFYEFGGKEIDSSPQSPDPSAIEHLCDEL